MEMRDLIGGYWRLAYLLVQKICQMRLDGYRVLLELQDKAQRVWSLVYLIY